MSFVLPGDARALTRRKSPKKIRKINPLTISEVRKADNELPEVESAIFQLFFCKSNKE